MTTDSMTAIQKQMGFYFSDANLRRDKFLLARTGDKGTNYVEVAVFLTFNKIKQMVTDAGKLAEAIRGIPTLELSEDAQKVKRKLPLPEVDDTDERTLYIEPIPKDSTIESLEAKFQKYGVVLYVSLPRHPAPSRNLRGFAFIEFEAVAHVTATCKALHGSENDLRVLPKKEWLVLRKKAQEADKRSPAPQSPAAGSEPSFPPGVIIRVEGMGSGCLRQHIKHAFEPYGAVVYVNFKEAKDCEMAHVRMAEAPHAKRACGELTGKKQKLGGEIVTMRVLEGEEEVAYWAEVRKQPKPQRPKQQQQQQQQSKKQTQQAGKAGQAGDGEGVSAKPEGKHTVFEDGEEETSASTKASKRSRDEAEADQGTPAKGTPTNKKAKKKKSKATQ